jgi:hypothetical protein
VNLLPNQTVKLFFKNQLVIEGIVVSWYANNYLLQSLDKSYFIMIEDPKDIFIARINNVLVEQNTINETSDSDTVETHQDTTIGQDVNLDNCFIIDDQDNEVLNNKSLLELRQLEIAQENKDIVSKLRNHYISNVSFPKYDSVSMFTKKKG